MEDNSQGPKDLNNYRVNTLNSSPLERKAKTIPASSITYEGIKYLTNIAIIYHSAISYHPIISRPDNIIQVF